MSLSLLAAAAEAPEREALVVSGRPWTFAELAARMRALLPALERRVPPGDRAALVGTSDLDTLVVLYGLVELGRPVVLLHPRWSERERRRFLAAAAPAVEVDPASLEPGEVTMPASPPDDGRPLAIVPTSGSSGTPKGAVLSRRAFVAAARASAEVLGWREDDRWLLSLPVAHVGGLSVLTRCLLARRTVVVAPPGRFEAAEMARTVEDERITLLSLVPTTLRRLLELDRTPPPRLRAVLVGGAAAPPALLEAAAERGWPVRATYGLTEACSQVATQPDARTPGVGPPLPGMEVRISDGAIELRGPQLMDGYLGTPDDPFTADGWLRTGDLGRLDAAGNLHVLGRRDAVVVTGGENVAAEEVEAALGEHPGISASAVFGVADAEWGEAVAAVLVARGEPVADGELVRHLGERLARFKWPRRVAWLAELERLPSGKVDRRRTAEQARPFLVDLERGPTG